MEMNTISSNESQNGEGKNISKLVILVKKLKCPVCDHESENGAEYYHHDVYHHGHTPSGADYSLGWIVGTENTYYVMHGEVCKQPLPLKLEITREVEIGSFKSGHRIHNENNEVFEIIEEVEN